MKILNLIERIPHMEKNEETVNNLFDESTKKYFENIDKGIQQLLSQSKKK